MEKKNEEKDKGNNGSYNRESEENIIRKFKSYYRTIIMKTFINI